MYRKHIAIFIIIILSITACMENQESKTSPVISNDPLFYINNIYSYWSTERYDTAIIYADRLMKLSPQFLIEMLHNEVALGISENQIGASCFVDELKDADITGLNEIIEPISIWNKIHNTESKDSLVSLFSELTSNLKLEILSQNKVELYALKAINELAQKELLSNEQIENVCELIIGELGDNLNSKDFLMDRELQVKRAYIRLILSNSYYILSEYKDEEINLKMAGYYSPDNTDRENIHGYFYSSVILTGDYENFGFQQKYLDYLLKHHRDQDALIVLGNMTLNEPINNNIIKFKTHYEKTNPSKNFKQYWHNLISLNSVIFPELIFTTMDSITISSKDFIGRWTLIDVWGTWCVPCISELPELESFYTDSLGNYNNQLKILTLSSGSENLIGFMGKNNYTFPVAEIEKDIVKKLKINGYPTKLLISPEGRYRVIPFNANWVEYINNYVLITKKTITNNVYKK